MLLSPDSDPCRNRILAQPPQRLLPPQHSRRRRQRAHLRSLLASLPRSASPLAADPQPALKRACAKRNRRRAPARQSAALPRSRLGRRQSQVRCPRRSRSRRHAPAEKARAPVCGSSSPAARLKVKKPRCLKPGRTCSLPTRSLPWSLLRDIPSASPQWLRCWISPASPGSGAPTGNREPPIRCRSLPGQIVLLDTIGELASVYSLAAVALSAAASLRRADTIRWSPRNSAFPL